MTFTNNRLDLFDGESYGEIQHANAFAKGMPDFVVQGLELTGNTLSSGIFNNTGTFGQLGSVNETHTITANYTGFIVIESTLSGRTSTSRIIESPTFLSTDPRTASSVRHFTIYELSNGSIVNDFRHIDYVKSFEVRNIGGSQFVFILNGFVSAPFDASVLAGNRTLINDKDIGYDDTIHATTPLQDILKDLFDKSQVIVGDDKPFELNFRIAGDVNGNLMEACLDLIEQNYGYRMTNDFLNFSMKVATSQGISNENGTNLNLVSIFSDSDGVFSWVFDYDNWTNVIVRDAAGYTSATYLDDRFNDKLGITAKAADSNLLDGLDVTQFVRSDIDDNVAGIKTFTNSVITNVDFTAASNANEFSFRVTSDGYVGFRSDVNNPGYYLKKESQDNTSVVHRYSTLRLGDVVIHLNDSELINNLPNPKQIPTEDFGTPIRPNSEGEECIFLIDILENMQNKINTLENEVAILKGK